MYGFLTPDERKHYEWLIRGLLDGTRRLLELPGREDLVRASLDMVEELFLEVAIRVDATGPDFLVRGLEAKMIDELVASVANEPELGAVDGYAVRPAELLEPDEETVDLLRAAISESPQSDSLRPEDWREIARLDELLERVDPFVGDRGELDDGFRPAG